MTSTVWSVVNELKSEFVLNIKFFCVFGEKGNEILIVTENDKVFAFGSNKYGCLGLGHYNAVKEPEIVNELCDKQVIDISYGYYFVLVLNKSGKCFSWGRNNYGQLGNGTKTDENKPKLINALHYENVIQIVCGGYHSLVLTKSGDLYGFGRNINRDIGCRNNTNQMTPIKIIGFNNERIVSIACGKWHLLVLTNFGNVYGWGRNGCGELGIGNKKNQNRPQKIDLNNNQIIKSISCGQYHSLLLTTAGDIYAFGYNNFGQIGNGNQTNQLNPVKINGSIKFKEIASNHFLNISVAKAVDDYCYVWGQSKNDEFLRPQKTKIKSIDEIFALFPKLKITPKPIHLSSTTG
jgi:RCC1 and BTB domain-containing protein